jgi:UDP:flavonoid glycosyltransferase YjiC (YdhE family)
MAKILFVWELGLGFGHLNRYTDMIRSLIKEKHKLYFAARDVGNAEKAFGKEKVSLLQAPFLPRGVDNPIRVPRTYAHLVHNIGFNNATALTGRIKAWRQLYDFIKPDLIIYDHSPTAQLAFRDMKTRHVLCGTGFTVPPARVPMPNMRSWENTNQDALLNTEKKIIDVINLALNDLKLPHLVNVADLLNVDAKLLLTFKELDHYEDRGDAEYLGVTIPEDYGESPKWPAGGERKVFAYLYPFKTLSSLLDTMNKSKVSAIIYAPEVQRAVKNKHRSERLMFVEKPRRITEVTQQCDFAITNGTHATTAAVLLAGKPLLTLPQNLERLLVSRRIREMGAGLVAPQLKPEGMSAKFNSLMTTDQFMVRAQEFASKYANFSRKDQSQRIMEILNGVLEA